MLIQVVASDHRQALKFRLASVASARFSVARSDAQEKQANICVPATSTDVIISTMRSRLPARVHGVEQPVRASCGSHDLDHKRGPSGRRLQVPGIPMSSRTCQLLGCV